MVVQFIRSFWLLLLFLLIFTRTFLLAAINVSYRYDLKSYIKLFLSTVEHVGISDERSSKYVTKELNLHKFVMTLYHACTISITGWIWYDRSKLKQIHHHLLHDLARMIIHWGWENISNDGFIYSRVKNVRIYNRIDEAICFYHSKINPCNKEVTTKIMLRRFSREFGK